MKNPRKILIVEDEEVIQALCRRLLARIGYEAVFASGVGKALESIAGMNDLDMLITDMKLPDGGGIGVIEGFRQKYPSAKVLVMTGSPMSDARAGALQKVGFSEGNVLFKPFETAAFEAAVRACFKEA